MGRSVVVIPEKIYFKIGEVCELVGVQAHVLRYWETEFPMLSPQKNRSGQRSYRRRDVEVALRIKELLYDEMFTIAGAKKKLQVELRENSKLKGAQPESEAVGHDPGVETPMLFDTRIEANEFPESLDMSGNLHSDLTPEKRRALKSLAAELLELRDLLRNGRAKEAETH
jgi:DNA-binding transcriptional MerR regulator